MSRCVASTPTRVQRLLAVPREDQKMSDASQKGPSDALPHQLSRGLRGRVLKNAARSAARPSTPLGVVLRRRRRADATDHRTLPEARCTIVPLIVRSSGHSRPSRRTRSAATSVSARSSLQRGLAALEKDRPAARVELAAVDERDEITALPLRLPTAEELAADQGGGGAHAIVVIGASGVVISSRLRRFGEVSVHGPTQRAERAVTS